MSTTQWGLKSQIIQLGNQLETRFLIGCWSLSYASFRYWNLSNVGMPWWIQHLVVIRDCFYYHLVGGVGLEPSVWGGLELKGVEGVFGCFLGLRCRRHGYQLWLRLWRGWKMGSSGQIQTMESSLRELLFPLPFFFLFPFCFFQRWSLWHLAGTLPLYI